MRKSDTRTCWKPGDQEHDHAMCEDVVAETAAEVARGVTRPSLTEGGAGQ